MSTSLLNCEVELSRQMGDFWSSTTTSGGSTTTVIDTALKAKANDWIDGDREMWDMITSGTYDEEERHISSLANSTGTLTTLAHGGTIATSVTYRVHRLFSASDKRRALVFAARSVFPSLFEQVRNESMVSGNWLKDGSFEKWTDSTNLTYWAETTVTATKTTASPYYKHGATSCKLDTAAGYASQSISEWDDLKQLAGKSVTFTLQGWCDTASTLRIAIYDGTTTTYSSYHPGNSAWTEDGTPLKVQATIAATPTAVEFRVYLDTANTAYIDDGRVMGPRTNRIYIGDLGLAQNKPHEVFKEKSYYSTREPWVRIRGTTMDYKNGYLYIPSSIPSDARLRILGMGYLDFYDTSDVVGTDWADTIDLDSPQTDILVAQAAMYLCNQMVVPNNSTGDRKEWVEALNYWAGEMAKRKSQYGMTPPDTVVDYSV